MRINLNTITGLLAGIMFLAAVDARSQETGSDAITLDRAIAMAREKSVAALAAKSEFISSYWSYRSYKASMLPSFNLYGNLASFDRSLSLMQNYETGEMGYVTNYNMQNSLGLSIRQNLAFTGGTLSVYTDLTRVDQFGANPYQMWYAQPVTIYYSQPLLSYNEFKWQKKISPKEYEKAERVYIESMEDITISAVKYYFNLMLAHKNHETAVSNYENTRQMYAVAGERLKLGSVTMDEYLQLELSMLNDSISINEASIAVREAQMVLNSLLGLDEKTELVPVADEILPDVTMDYDIVMAKALRNSSFHLENEINMLNAESAIAQAKANRGATVSLSATFGLSNSSSELVSTYKDLMDQEVFGLTFSIPIFDWGLGKGRVKEAEAQAEVVKAQVEQAESDYRREVFTAVGQFNSQRQQCYASARASSIALKRYQLVMEKFRNSTATVTDLNTAQSEYNSASEKYITDLSNFWTYYYTLRQLTLYDFLEGKDLAVDFDELVN